MKNVHAKKALFVRPLVSLGPCLSDRKVSVKNRKEHVEVEVIAEKMSVV